MSVFTRPDEPVFNVPSVLVVLIAVMAVIQVGREYLLTADQDLDLLVRFAFIPFGCISDQIIRRHWGT